MSSRRVAIVTGAGSGIGRAVALGLAGTGFRVVAGGRRVEELENTAALCVGECVAVSVDVTQAESVEALFARTRQEFGRVDVLFNNAGINAPAVPLEELSVDDWRRVVEVNLTGAFLCAREAVRMMKTQEPRGGRIINNGSISAHVPRANSAAYTASKHALTGLTKSIALDGRAFSIACGQIDIGNAATEMTAQSAEPRIDVRHVADAVVYMAGLPLDANVLFMNVMATGMPFVGRG